jgi:hypothetical protein
MHFTTSTAIAVGKGKRHQVIANQGGAKDET